MMVVFTIIGMAAVFMGATYAIASLFENLSEIHTKLTEALFEIKLMRHEVIGRKQNKTKSGGEKNE